MIFKAVELNGEIQPAYEVHLECANCGMVVDNDEYISGTCTDCGQAWNEIRHTAVHVTSVPLSGETM